MELIRLPLGEQAEVDTDCIRIEEGDDGRFRLTGTALCVTEEEGSSVSLIDGPSFADGEAAETAGLAWADSVGVERLHIVTGTRDHPLRPAEIDLPG